MATGRRGAATPLARRLALPVARRRKVVGSGIAWRKIEFLIGDSAILVHPAVCMDNKEMIMGRRSVSTALLVLVLGLSLVPRAMARTGGSGSSSPWPRVVATVIALDPRGLATIRTVDGATYEVLKGTTWRVGDTVECEHVARTRVPWEALDCHKTS